MSIYSNVTEQDLENLRKLSEQQKNERARKIRNKILKQTHDIKLAESLSSITKNLDEVKETTQNLGDVIKANNTPQPAIENSPQPTIENNQDDTQPGILYDVELENTFHNMRDNQKGFFKIREDKNGQRFWNEIPIEISGDSTIEIKDTNFNITPNLQKVFRDTTGKSLKKIN